MASITIHKLDESFIKLSFENDGIARELGELLTFEVPGAKFSPAYKKRHWDGKIRLLNPRQNTLYAGLVRYVTEFARISGYTLDDQTDLNVKTNFSVTEAEDYIKTLKLPVEVRDYQLKAFVHAIRNRRGVLLSPTASGKSLIAYMISSFIGKKTLIVVPTTSLVRQMAGDFRSYGFKGSIHEIMAGVDKSVNADVVVSTWQSIYELGEEFFEDFDVVIGDEAHNCKAKSLISLMTKMKNTSYKLGMTGTLDGSEVHELVLTGLFGPIKKVTRTKDLMKAGHVAKLKIKMLVLGHSKEAAKAMVGKSYQEEMDIICNSDERNKFIRNLALSLKGNTLILFTYVDKQGKPLYEMIKEKAPVDTHFISGEVEADIREQIRKLVETGENLKIVASVGTTSTGVNMPRIHNMILASSTKSKIRILQSIGRGLRLGEDKDECKFFDIADNYCVGSHQNFTFKHAGERIKIYNSEGFDYEIYDIDLDSRPHSVFETL